MRVRVDKKEYKSLLDRVERLEEKVAHSERHVDILMKRMREEVERYFQEKCRLVVVKRDKEEIVAGLRKQVIDNIFKEESK